MRALAFVMIGLAASALAPATWILAPQPEPAASAEPPLADYVPDDVFLYVMSRQNPERAFLGDYWDEVFTALWDSGVGADVVELITSLADLGDEERAEMERIQQRAFDLVTAVDWGQLGVGETAFVERMGPPEMVIGEGAPFLMAEMVWIFRTPLEGVARNYDALVAILDALAEEVNRAAGGEVLAVQKEERSGTRMASVDFFASLPGAPRLPLAVAQRGQLIVIGLREQLMADVLALVEGRSTHAALADSPRFAAALEQLPPAEDSLSFFDLAALLRPILSFMDQVLAMASGPGDVYRNTGMSAELTARNAEAIQAYRRGDAAIALALTRDVHEAAPDNALVLYNLGCFSALVGERDAALTYLERAVEAGFHAPRKIGSDPDLESLRADPRYRAAVERAAKLAAEAGAEDLVVNSSRTGEAYRLTMQSWEAHKEKAYERALTLAEQAHAVAPDDPRPLYALACFHALLGHREQGLEFLGQAVDAGFYCPQHIAKDPDLEALRGSDAYQAALGRARRQAAAHAAEQTDEWARVARHVADRIGEVAGMIEYVAAVEFTEGHDVYTVSVVPLARDARTRSFYPVLDVPQLTAFDRYLPRETESFSVSAGVDLRALYSFLEDTLRQAGPRGEELLAKWAELQKQMGVDVSADVVDWIGRASVSVTLADGGGSVWMIEVKDEAIAKEKIAAAFRFVSERLPEVIAENRALTGLAMLSVHVSPVDDKQLAGFQNIHTAFSPQPAVWGVRDGYLMLGSSADAVRLCLATARGAHPSVRENERARREMLIPDGPFSAVSLTDQRQLGESLAQGIRIVSMISGMAGVAVPEPEIRILLSRVSGILTKLVPVVLKVNFYKSTASYTTFDGQTYRTRAVTHYFAPDERPAVAAP